MSAASEEEFDTDFLPDDRLFHYTNSEGLYGILQSGNVWATHFQFLNDSQEFYSAKKSLTKFLETKIRTVVARIKVNERREYVEGLDVRSLCEEEAVKTVNLMYAAIFGSEDDANIVGSDAFVFSTFCCNPKSAREFRDGTLLHWATYGRNGGYALQLNPHKIHRLIKNEERVVSGSPMLSGKASYAESGEVPTDLAEEYELIGKCAQRIYESKLKGQVPNDADISPLTIPFVKIISLLKDRYFSDEEEARIVTFRPRKGQENRERHFVGVRQANGMAIPYVKMFANAFLGEHCPIERIIVGPSSDNKRRLRALEIFLKIAGLEKIDVSESHVPFIS